VTKLARKMLVNLRFDDPVYSVSDATSMNGNQVTRLAGVERVQHQTSDLIQGKEVRV